MKEIKLFKNKGVALVDDSDFELISRYRWHLHVGRRTNYATTTLNGKTTFMHRMILKANKELVVDHIDQNGLNNCKSNLRLCTHSQNFSNQAIRKTNTLGYKGVIYRYGKPYARICVNYQYTSVGPYKSTEEAAKAYDCLAIEFRGEFAATNFPKEKYQEPNFAPVLVNRQVWGGAKYKEKLKAKSLR